MSDIMLLIKKIPATASQKSTLQFQAYHWLAYGTE
jgi:hypothetical protein